jgi:undecaprenyl diphosphate synthase
MELFEDSLKKNEDKIKRNNIRFDVIGRIKELPDPLRQIILRLRKETRTNPGIALTLALNYGGRQEIVDAVKNIVERHGEKGFDASAVTEKSFSGFLYTRDLPDPDLVIRTSGEMRISNFLLWQSAYSEFYITDTLWPDFDAKHLDKALEEYEKRDRRFGG